MPEVYDNRGVLAPEDGPQDCGAWLLWIDPSGARSSTSALAGPPTVVREEWISPSTFTAGANFCGN